MSELRVVEMWRYPVKSMLGERVEQIEVAAHGMCGDRAWSLVDSETGLNLTARREPALLMASARLVGDSVEDGVTVTLPNGTETSDDAELSTWIGRPVELRRADPSVSGTYETTLDEAETGSWVQWTGPSGSFHDSTRTMVSLVSRSTMGTWDRRRFRINVILEGHGEEALVGSSVRLGQVGLDVTKQIDRCVMVTRPQPALQGEPALDRDLSVLRTINNERQSVLGIGALVNNSGTVSIGDIIEPTT